MDTGRLETLLKLADHYGVALVVMVILLLAFAALGLAAWLSLKWFAKTIAGPLFTRHVQFLDRTESFMGALATNQRQMMAFLQAGVCRAPWGGNGAPAQLCQEDTHAAGAAD